MWTVSNSFSSFLTVGFGLAESSTVCHGDGNYGGIHTVVALGFRHGDVLISCAHTIIIPTTKVITEASSSSSDDDGVGAGGSSSKKIKEKKGMGKKPTRGKERLTPTDAKWPKDVPEHFKTCEKDWRVDGILRDVMHQRDWDVCWSVALTGSIEAAVNIKAMNGQGNRCPTLSAQHLINNVKKLKRGKIRKYEAIRRFLVNEGLVTEDVCEYTGDIYSNACSHETPVTKIKHLQEIKRKEIKETDLIEFVAHQGPVMIVIESFLSFGKLKGDEIFRGQIDHKDNAAGRHALLLIGYGTTEDGTHYWLVQNSYGDGWGEKGYGKIIRQCSLPPNSPSLVIKVVYPEV